MYSGDTAGCIPTIRFFGFEDMAPLNPLVKQQISAIFTHMFFFLVLYGSLGVSCKHSLLMLMLGGVFLLACFKSLARQIADSHPLPLEHLERFLMISWDWDHILLILSDVMRYDS